MKALWRIWIAVAVGLTTLYFLVEDTPESKLVLYNGVGLMSVVMVLVGVSVNKPPVRAPWLWFAAGLTSFLTADIVYYVLELTSEGGPPFPSAADAFYLGMYPLMIVGLTMMVRSIRPDRNATTFIDAAIVGIGMFATLWILFVDQVWETATNTTAALVVQLAYPVMDVALLAVAARLVVTAHLKHPPFAFIVGAIGALAVADTAYGIFNANGTFQTGLWVDLFWLSFYVGFGAAALHPAVAENPTFARDEDRLTVTQLVIMFCATLGVPMIDLIWGTQADRVVTIVASALMFLLILARVFSLMSTIEAGKERLRHDAEHDNLTGLSNRARFAHRTEAALIDAGDHRVGVLFIDLDDFKTVNDSLGHQAGDVLLAEVATRLENCIGNDDVVARFGGDEFAVLMTAVSGRRDVTNMARRILEEINQPVDLGTRTVRASASIGVAVDYDGRADVETILRNADVAMYLSKSRGKGRFELFEPVMHEEAIERLDLKADLQRAIDEEQFSLNYQPIFDFESGKVTLVECLIRWKHPERGLVPPDKFIPLAEETGLIVPIGEMVLREACKQAAQWQRIEGCEDLAITVNLSIRQLHDPTLVNSLTNALRDSGLSARHLVLEITESMLAVDAETSAGILSQLKTIGVKLAIDDFGTGYSSLSYLRSFPVDAIKIDRSFINELHRSQTSTALVEAVVNLSKALGAYTVAEGIEYADQAGILRRLGCDHGQGFYYCRPLSAPDLTALFREHNEAEVEPLEAWRLSAERVQDRDFDMEIRVGMGEIRSHAADIEDLVADLDLPVMGSWPWLTHWADSFAHWTPMMVEVRAADTRQLMACALLASDRRADGTKVVAMGHGSSLYAGLPSRDAESARALAQGIAHALHELDGAWSLDLEQLPESDPVLHFLVDEFAHGQILPELRVPRVVFSSAHTVEEVLSKSKRKQLKRARNRIEADGLEMLIGFDRGRAISTELLDEVESVHVSRDRHARRNSDLDRPAEREFWRRVVEGGNDEWEIEIATLRLDGELAAYAVAILDGDTYRIYDGRMSTKWQDYSPGRLVEAAALNRAISDPRFAILDWMSGVAAEKLLTTNMAEGRARLVATSGSRYLDASRTKVSAGS